MALKTTGSLEGDSFKATTASALTPGFVTNDPTGLLEYGQGGASTPIGASVWDFIEHKELPSETNCLTFSGLSGNADKLYKLVFRNLLIPEVIAMSDTSLYVSGEDLIVGETVVGQTSGSTGTVESWTPALPGFAGSVLVVKTVTGDPGNPNGDWSGQGFLPPAPGEVVTGNTSGFSVTLSGPQILPNAPSLPNVHYTMRPNGLTTGQKSTIRAQETSVTPVNATFPEMTIVYDNNVTTSGVIYLFAKTGKARSFYSDSALASALPPFGFGRCGMQSSFGLWTDTVTNITSLDICSSLVNGGLPAGSSFTLYKINN